MQNVPDRKDPIGDRYFQVVDIAETATQILFILAAILSLGFLVVDKYPNTWFYQAVHITFILAAIGLFIVNLALRLYWSPIAADKRCLDLLSYAYSLPLIYEQTVKYYNNNETSPIRRLGLAIMENSFFSESICSAMLRLERIKLSFCLIVLIAIWLNKSSNFTVIELAAQVVFSEYIVSYWCRLEWFRSRCKICFDSLYALFNANPQQDILHAQMLNWVIFYESTKSNAGITLSSNLFEKMNPSLTQEWENIKAALSL